VFSVGSMPRGYKKDKEVRSSHLSFETPTCQYMIFEGEELNCGTEASELLSEVQLRVQSPAVKRRLYECYSTVIFGVCYSMRLL
jgi:hypothetical protein